MILASNIAFESATEVVFVGLVARGLSPFAHLMMHPLSNGLTELRENVTTRELGGTNPLVDPKGLLEQLPYLRQGAKERLIIERKADEKLRATLRRSRRCANTERFRPEDMPETRSHASLRSRAAA
ncbi:hypothetical protein [Bradyrhizobium sp. STM 3843]|uniref:hypothetical protein n=1 Tax=Bradyrhizobium sp. STM 3843 TaxID=551947 RepID=UPI00055E8997|nr:hypothetical protein [Bradyrhizobium sp. STM 3843]